jgi:hypothetical protein
MKFIKWQSERVSHNVDAAVTNHTIRASATLCYLAVAPMGISYRCHGNLYNFTNTYFEDFSGSHDRVYSG